MSEKNELMVVRHVFEGTGLESVVMPDGRPAWVARHVGEVIGYENGGRRFPQKILADWSDELKEGSDYAFLVGDDLDAYKAANVHMAPERSHVDRTARLLVLFESGINLALLKTTKPLGRELRRFLADEVLPQLVRTGQYAPTGAPEAERLAAVERDVSDLKVAVTGLTTAVAGLVEGVAGIAQGVQGLLAHAQIQQAPNRPLPGGVTVNLPGAHVHITEPAFPPQYSVHGLKQLAGFLECSHQRARTRLEATRLWGAEDWMLIAQRTVPRGNRLDVETVYRFKPGIVEELRRREAPLFHEDPV